MKRVELSIVWLLFAVILWSQSTPATEITKWQDGKQACVSLTFDDSSINQFRIGIPLLNERGLPATFFVITGNIPGSRFRASFTGRPIMEIIRESETVPTSRENLFERTSLLNYLRTAQRVPQISEFNAQGLARLVRQGSFEELGRAVDGFLAKLRQGGVQFPVRDRGGNAREGDRFRVYLRFFMKKVITVVVNSEHDARFSRAGSDRAESRIYSTRIAEVEDPGTAHEREKPVGRDGGYLWRLNTYWRFLERDGGTYVQCESITLTRGIPIGLGWLVRPFVTSIPRETLEFTLATTRKALAP